MLDIHAPHSRVEGFRDFMLHLLTITCGLLIALGLEASVEVMHHRHQREEAETKIRQEISGNLEKLQNNVARLQSERETMKQLIVTLRVIAAEGHSTSKEIKLDFTEEEIPDAAWRTASTTGVLEYVPYDEVEKFADAYREQALLQQILQKALEDYLELTPVLDHNLSREEATVALPLALKTLGHLNGVLAAGTGTAESYQDALK